MGTVYYGLAGDGHGHATRATTVIEHLLSEHDVIVLTFGRACKILREHFDNDIELRQVEGLHFEYGLYP
jgi:Glycosyl transferase family 1